MKIYRGERITHRGTRVFVSDGEREAPLDPRLDLVPHSPDGFNWGYGGSGPAQLALAILAECCGDDVALRFHQDFKWEKIAPMEEPEWTITEGEVYGWLEARVRELVDLARRLGEEAKFWRKACLDLEREVLDKEAR